MNFSTDFNSVPLPTVDTLLFWGFIISGGILVAQLSTKLSERFFPEESDEFEDIAESDESNEVEAGENGKAEVTQREAE